LGPLKIPTSLGDTIIIASGTRDCAAVLPYGGSAKATGIVRLL
jgi:hypothetical protein